jgi:hypothetical protein
MAGRYSYIPINEDNVRIISPYGEILRTVSTREFIQLLRSGQLPVYDDDIPILDTYVECDNYNQATQQRLLIARYIGEGLVQIFNRQTGQIYNIAYNDFVRQYSHRGPRKITSNCLGTQNIDDVRQAFVTEQTVRKEHIEKIGVGGTYYVIGQDDSAILYTVPKADLNITYSKSRQIVTVMNRSTGHRYEFPLDQFVQGYIDPFYDRRTNTINPENTYNLSTEQANFFITKVIENRERPERERREREEREREQREREQREREQREREERERAEREQRERAEREQRERAERIRQQREHEERRHEERERLKRQNAERERREREQREQRERAEREQRERAERMRAEREQREREQREREQREREQREREQREREQREREQREREQREPREDEYVERRPQINVDEAIETLRRLGITNKRECKLWLGRYHPDRNRPLPPGSPSLSEVSALCSNLKTLAVPNFTFRRLKKHRK